MASSFTVTKDLALNSDIVLTCWCPTMDLCAVVSSDGQLHLHRMDWEQLWAVSPEALVTAICWRPDGKQLAAGHANGAISLLDVETGDTVSENKVHYAAIATLQWCDQAAQPDNARNPSTAAFGGKTSLPARQLLAPQHSMLPHQRFKRLFVPPELSPRSSSEALPDPYDLCMEATGVAAWPAERAVVSLLCAGDARGHVSLWLQGQVQIAEVPGGIPSSVPEQAVHLSEGPHQLVHAVADSELQQLLTVNRSASGGVVLIAHSLAALHEHQQPLQQCTALFSHIQGFLQAAQKALEVCKQEWCSVMADFNKRFDTQLKQELSDQGFSCTVPQQELLLLLATGACSAPLESFLGGTLGESGLRRIARSVDAAGSGLHTALLERLLPLAELVLFLVGELRGAVVAASAAEGWMGLQVDTLQQLELQAAALLLRLEQLRRVVTSSACQYRAFCGWLLKTIQQLEGGAAAGSSVDTSLPLPQCQEVLCFLKGQFLHDVIGPELAGSGLDPEAQAWAEARFYQGILPSETHQLLALLLPCCPQQQQQMVPQPAAAATPNPQLVTEAAAACSRPLGQQLQHLSSLAESAFELPVMHLSPCITPAACLQLLPATAALGGAEEAGGSSGVSGGLPGSAASPLTSPTRAPVAAATAAAGGVALGPPLLQPQQCVDPHTYIVCLVPKAAAAAAARADVVSHIHQQNRQLLLVVRLASTPSSTSSTSSGTSSGSLSAEAVLLQLPHDTTAEAWVMYKDQQLAVLLHNRSLCGPGVTSPGRFGASTPSSSSSGSSSLHLVGLSEAPWAAVTATALQQEGQQGAACAPSSSTGSALQQCVAAGAVVGVEQLPCRSCVLLQGRAGQLAVSRARGLGSVVSDLQHLLLLDLEEDQEAEDGEDGEEDEGMPDADEDGAADMHY